VVVDRGSIAEERGIRKSYGSISAFVSWFENKRVTSLVICKEYPPGHRERRGRT
jgi:hypothetical protein